MAVTSFRSSFSEGQLLALAPRVTSKEAWLWWAVVAAEARAENNSSKSARVAQPGLYVILDPLGAGDPARSHNSPAKGEATQQTVSVGRWLKAVCEGGSGATSGRRAGAGRPTREGPGPPP